MHNKNLSNKILKIYGISVLVGIFTGLVGSFFQLAIHSTNQLLQHWFHYAVMHGWSLATVSALTSMSMVYLAWLMVNWFAKEASGSGVQEIEGTLLHVRPIFWRRLLPIKFLGGVLAIAAKMVVGREGPTIQMGGNLGAMVGELYRVGQRRCDTLIAAGAAAGLATAFNAPLAGVLFVLEEMRDKFNFSFTNFNVVTICCVSATVVMHSILGSHPAIPMDIFDLPSLPTLGLFFIFGMMVGIVAFLFNRILMKTLYAMDSVSLPLRNLYVLLIGLMVGYFAYTHPEVVGGGYDIIQQALTINPTLSFLIIVFLVRFIMTILCYNTSVPGGIFAPLLALGTLLGLTVEYGIQVFIPDVSLSPGMFAVAGMGALFAAAVRAPITGIVLVVEMTQNYSLILPLMITCLTANTIVQLTKNPPIYTQLLRRTLKKQGQSIEGTK